MRSSGLRGPYDFVIVGGGVAGLRAAIGLAPAGHVLVLTKAEPAESNTGYAQGGIAAAIADDDSAALHVRPGQRVRAGQLVAEVESLELTDLQRELLDAQNDAQLSEKNSKMLEDSGVPSPATAEHDVLELLRALGAETESEAG